MGGACERSPQRVRSVGPLEPLAMVTMRNTVLVLAGGLLALAALQTTAGLIPPGPRDSLDVSLHRARAAEDAGNPLAALHHLHRATTTIGDAAFLMFEIGRIHLSMGHLEDAEAWLADAFSIRLRELDLPTADAEARLDQALRAIAPDAAVGPPVPAIPAAFMTDPAAEDAQLMPAATAASPPAELGLPHDPLVAAIVGLRASALTARAGRLRATGSEARPHSLAASVATMLPDDVDALSKRLERLTGRAARLAALANVLGMPAAAAAGEAEG